jgi:LysM repeat protein
MLGFAARWVGFAWLAVVLLVAAPSVALAGRIEHTVAPGETLGGIAKRYGVKLGDLRKWNSKVKGDRIREGQKLRVEVQGRSGGSARSGGRGGRGASRGGSAEVGQTRSTYVVRSGDTGLSIARKRGFSMTDLQRWNRGVNLNRLRIGQKLTIYVAAEAEYDLRPGSPGTPNRGRLNAGTVLPQGSGYDVRNPARASGTPATVAALQWGMSRLAARHPDGTNLVVGDLSFPGGGRMPPHKSHQNGLDADICLLTTESRSACVWRVVGADELDTERMWYLFKSWMDQEYVEYIFLDRSLQRPLYEFAQARGASEAQLKKWFEYPARGGTRALIRHEPGHADHFHIRFVQR